MGTFPAPTFDKISAHLERSGVRTGAAVVCGYTYPLDFSKEERDLRLLRAYRARLGTMVLVARSPDGADHLWQEDGIIVRYVPRRGFGALGLLRFWIRGVLSTWALVRRHGLGVAYASDLAGAFMLIPLKPLTGVRMLLHLQWPFFELSPLTFPWGKRFVFRIGARIACHFADSIRCVTEDVRQQAIRAHVNPRKLMVIPSRCDTALFDPVRVQARVAGSGRQLVYIGSLAGHKGMDVLLAAMPKILDRVPNARLRIVGDGPLRQALEEQVLRQGLAPAVEFAGYQQYSALPAVLGSADVFVFPSFSEAMPRAILEAMAMERPVVVTRVGGNPEAVRDGVEGLLVPPGDPKALASAVCRVLEDTALAEGLGRRGRQRVLDCFSFEENMRALVAWHHSWARKGSGDDRISS